MGIFEPNIERMTKKRDANGLIKALKHKGWLIRADAAEALGKIRDKRAVEPLISALKDEDKQVRSYATEALGRIRDKRAVEPLIQAFTDKDSDIQEEVIKALAKIRDVRAIEVLTKSLGHYGYDVRDEIEKALSKMGEPAVVSLVNNLQSKRPNLRWEAAIALQNMSWQPKDDTQKVQFIRAKLELEVDEFHHEERVIENIVTIGNTRDVMAVEPLIQVLNDGDYSIQREAVIALGKIGDKRIVEPFIIQILKNDDPVVREEAAKILGKMENSRTIETLIQALKDKEKEIRTKAAEALGEMRDNKAIEPLIQVLKDQNREVREEAVEALGKIGDASAIEAVVRTLKDNDAYVQRAAAKAIEQIPDGRAADALGELLKTDNDYTREIVIEALAKIEDERATVPLVKALEDSTEALRWKAADALAKFGKAVTEAILSTPHWQSQLGHLYILAKVGQKPDIIPHLIRCLFANPRSYMEVTKTYLNSYGKSREEKYFPMDLCKAKEALMSLSSYSNLDERTIDLIIKASSYSSYGTHYPQGDLHEHPVYDDAIAATKKLCESKTQLTSNILDMVCKKKDISVTMGHDDFGDHKVKVSFANQRKIASKELEARHFTQCDDSVFLRK